MPLHIKRYNNDQWGVFCHAKLDSGELVRITVMHGPVTRLGLSLPWAPVHVLVDTLRWGGLRRGYDILRYDLRPDEHAARIAQLPFARRSDSPVTVLDSMIDYLRDCNTVVEVKQRCDALVSLPFPATHWQDENQDEYAEATGDDLEQHDGALDQLLAVLETAPSPSPSSAAPSQQGLRATMEFVLSLADALDREELRALTEGSTRDMVESNPGLLLIPLEYETLKKILCPTCGSNSWDSVTHASLRPREDLNWSHSIGGDYHECTCNGCGHVLSVAFWFSR